MSLVLRPIGIIHTPYKTREGMPIQPTGCAGSLGEVEVFVEFREGLCDLEGFSHLILIYHFHLSEGFNLRVVPFLDEATRGVFATRAPRRPNPIGLSVVALESIQNGRLTIRNADILDGTPLLDIKPLVPQFDMPADVRTGWLEKATSGAALARSDDRFL
ncbi:MAG: tRNA (N6-threonylcarbamoyladenosine(37)-N6)-methyltransferase TrmO [Candidatus Sumerlaeia bacterium]|nr:tRNA (N6-threonylcarbamoyladenosine(37)-N6)-methyltransferase TrmO [Candidatus Sumerlaeia bacterium]